MRTKIKESLERIMGSSLTVEALLRDERVDLKSIRMVIRVMVLRLTQS